MHQIPVLEDALVAMGVATWAMVEYEADDALGAAAAIADADARVEQVLIVTPDKDLCQCVRGTRVVQFDRRKREIIDEAGVIEKFGVGPASIPDYLGLVGDTADGYPGLPGWGAKSAAGVLARYGHLEDIPPSVADWEVPGVRGTVQLAATLRSQIEPGASVPQDRHRRARRRGRHCGRLVLDRPDPSVRRRRPTDRRARMRRSRPSRRSRAGPDRPCRPAAADPPPAEVTTRRSAAHERCR